MKNCFIPFILCVFLFTSCSVSSLSKDGSAEKILSNKYSVGNEVKLGDVAFNIYKIDDKNNELYLLAQKNIITTPFSDTEHSGFDANEYEGSLVEGYVNRFVDDLEDKGFSVKSSGIIDQEDLYELGFKHSDSLSGLPYKCDDVLDFVKYEDDYWVGGYCKYNTQSWVYRYGELDTQSCDDEYGVRPIIIIEPSEIEKQPQEVDEDLTIKDIVDCDSAWTSEGGIYNQYDRFYFDCENMLFIVEFESSELKETNEYSMEFIDKKTIQISGFISTYNYPAEITIVNENKLRLRFLDNRYNDGDYYLNKSKEKE